MRSMRLLLITRNALLSLLVAVLSCAKGTQTHGTSMANTLYSSMDDSGDERLSRNFIHKKKVLSLDPTYIPYKATKEKKIPNGKKDPQSGSTLPHEMNTSLFPVELLDFNLTRD